jgi:hypothetical protein
MIHFPTKPDPIFLDLVNHAIDETVERYLSFDDPRDQEDWLCAGMPRSARFFPGPEAKQHLLDLQKALNDCGLHEVSKYHWLLLYECLETFCQEFNEQPAGVLVEQYGIQRVLFRSVISLFFWDIDFLDDNIANMTQQQRHMMIFPETFGLSAGFTRDPEELAIKLCDERLTREFDARQSISLNAGAKEYPSAPA